MIDLKQVDLSYLEVAPSSMQMTANVQAPIEFVFKTFEDPEAWVHCFKSITRVDWTTQPPHKKGAARTIDLKIPGQAMLTIDEEFVEWEQNKRFSFYFKRANRRVFGAMLEDYKFSEGGDGSTDIVWDAAFEGAGIFRFLFKFMSGQARKDNQKALDNFKAYIEEKYSARV